MKSFRPNPLMKNYKSKISTILLLILFFFSFSLKNVKAIHPDLDTSNVWVKINDGFAKCAEIGDYAGWAEWNIDAFQVRTLLHRRGYAYALIGFGNYYENKEPCLEGLFYHDTIENKWWKTAETPEGTTIDGVYIYSMDELLTNGDEIFALCHTEKYVQAVILQHTTDYANYPQGWKMLSKAPQLSITNEDVFPPGCQDGVWNNAFDGPKAAIGDTIFLWFWSREAACTGMNIIWKFNWRTREWSNMALPDAPRGRPNSNSPDFKNMEITDAIGGYFKYFMVYRTEDGTCDFGDAVDYAKYVGKCTPFTSCVPSYANPKGDTCVPDFVYVYDPRDNSWKDISRGPMWGNFTGSDWGVDGNRLFKSWDNKRILVQNQTGTYE